MPLWLLTPNFTVALMQQQPYFQGHHCTICCFQNLTTSSAAICLLLIFPVSYKFLPKADMDARQNSGKREGEKQIPCHIVSERSRCLSRIRLDHKKAFLKIRGALNTCRVVYFGNLSLGDSLNRINFNESQMKYHNSKLGRGT